MEINGNYYNPCANELIFLFRERSTSEISQSPILLYENNPNITIQWESAHKIILTFPLSIAPYLNSVEAYDASVIEKGNTTPEKTAKWFKVIEIG